MAVVYLYKFIEYVQLVKADTNAPNINYPMIQYDIKVYKGVSNTIDFIVRDADRKFVKLIDYQLSAIIQTVDEPNYAGPEILLTKPVQIVDELTGKARLILEPEDIETWNTGYYQYSIQVTDSQGCETYLFTDVNKSAIAQFQLLEGMARSLQPAIEIFADGFTPTPIGDYGIIYTTGALAGDSQSQRANGTHTVAVYTENFTGKFWIQASLTNDAPLPDDWFDVTLDNPNNFWSYTPDQKIKQFTFFGNYYWVRFQYQEATENKGNFLKLLYKN